MKNKPKKVWIVASKDLYNRSITSGYFETETLAKEFISSFGGYCEEANVISKLDIPKNSRPYQVLISKGGIVISAYVADVVYSQHLDGYTHIKNGHIGYELSCFLFAINVEDAIEKAKIKFKEYVDLNGWPEETSNKIIGKIPQIEKLKEN